MYRSISTMFYGQTSDVLANERREVEEALKYSRHSYKGFILVYLLERNTFEDIFEIF